MSFHHVFALCRPEIRAAGAPLAALPPGWTVLDVTPGHDVAARVREALAASADLIVACGDEDLMRGAAQGLLRTDVPLALVPVETSSGFAVELGLPSDPHEALALAEGAMPSEVRLLDVGDAEAGGLFLLRLSIGPEARHLHEARPPVRYRIRLDGRRPFYAVGAACVVCTGAHPDLNSLSSAARVSDGLLHVLVTADGLNAAALLSRVGAAARRLLAGRHHRAGHRSTGHHWTARQVEIAPEPYQEATCDGVPLQPRFVIRACVHTGALRVLVPAPPNGHERPAPAHGVAVQAAPAAA